MTEITLPHLCSKIKYDKATLYIQVKSEFKYVST